MKRTKAMKRTRAIALIGPLLGAAMLAFAHEVNAFQIGVLGTHLEARLTNEPDASLARAAGRLGVLLKRPVHEEITQIAFDCPVDMTSITVDEACAV